ncbi:Uncharacterised protein [Vibrio cholerae]|nr:Uncharacterised protein [Vibrio cholerae]
MRFGERCSLFREIGVFDTALRSIHVFVNVIQVADSMVETVLERTQFSTVTIYILQRRVDNCNRLLRATN